MTLAALILLVQEAAQTTVEAVTTTAQQTASVVSMEESVTTLQAKIFAAYATVFVLKFIRSSPYFPILRENAAKMNKFVSICAAGLVSMGVSYTFNIMTIDEASRMLSITITFPTTVAAMHGIWAWGSQYVFQQLGYRMLVVSNENQKTISEQIAEAVGKPAGVAPEPPGVVKT